VAHGFAIIGRRSPTFDCYCLCGDGELQEGPIWEAVMYSGQKHLDNVWVMVDHNQGQLDLANRMVFPMPQLEAVFSSFGWQVESVDATEYDGMYEALERFRCRPRNGKPTAVICHSTKGHGALSEFLNKHKVTVPEALLEQEMALQLLQRGEREQDCSRFHRALDHHPEGRSLQQALLDTARNMHLEERSRRRHALDR
jgi:transketolase